MAETFNLTDVFALSASFRRYDAVVCFRGGTNFDLRAGFRGIELNRPIELRVRQGRDIRDFLFVDGRAFVVSKKVTDILESNCFTGWKKAPAVILDRKGILIKDGYFGLMITGRAGARDRSYTNCILFDSATWGGSDLFLLADIDVLLVTGRVIDALQSNTEITGYSFGPIVQ